MGFYWVSLGQVVHPRANPSSLRGFGARIGLSAGISGKWRPGAQRGHDAVPGHSGELQSEDQVSFSCTWCLATS